MTDPVQLVCLGVSHHTAPVELRECLRFSLAALSGETALRSAGLREFVLLSTCNRIEIYAAVAGDATEAQRLLLDRMAGAAGLDGRSLAPHAYYLSGIEVMRHLASVAAGLDSLVLGEAQILGQVTAAFAAAVEAHTIGPLLTALMRSAIRAGKRARQETSIAGRSASIASAAVVLARRTGGPLRSQRFLVVGLGEMGLLTLKVLRGLGHADLLVANRSYAKALAVAREFGGRAFALDALDEALAACDVAISATASPEIVLDAACVRRVQEHRGGQPLILIDIAVPRNIDPAVRSLTGVQLFDIDDLNGELDEALAARRRERPKVEAIIDAECARFAAEWRKLEVMPVVSELRQRAESIRQAELERTLRFLGADVDEATRAHLQHLTHALVNKLLHEPTVRLKELAADGQADPYADAVCDLFGLSHPGRFETP